MEYYICGRKAGARTVSLSMLASSIGGSATMGMIGLAWQVGTPAFWWLGSGVIGLLILGWLLARKIRASRARTLPELCQKKFGSSFRSFCAILIGLAYIPIVAAQFSAQALIIKSLAGMDSSTSLIIGAIMLLSYTFIGGQNAVIKSDVWQFTVLSASIILIFFFCVQEGAGRSALFSTHLELVNDQFPPSRLVYFLLILGSSFVVGPMLYGRLLSSRDQRSAKKACFFSAGVLLAMAFLITSIGLCLHGILPPDIMPPNFQNQEILGDFINRHLPEWAAILALLGLFSAIVSSADSCLFTAASICANDLLKSPTTVMCRVAMILITILAVLLSFQGKGILNLLLMANDIYVCGVVPPLFVGLLCKPHTISNVRLIMIAMLLGGGSGALASAIDMPDLSVCGFLLSLAICTAAVQWNWIKKRMTLNKKLSS